MPRALLCLSTFFLLSGTAAAQAPAEPPAAPAPGAALTPGALYQFTLAKLLAVEGSLPESLAAYEEAGRLAPGSAYVRVEHAQLLARVAQYAREDKARRELLQKAAGIISEAQRLAPDNLDVLRAVGSIYLDFSALDPAAAGTAQAALETVRGREPADAPSVITLAQLYLDQRQPDKAAEVLRDLVSRVPQQRMAYALLVESLLRSGKRKEAEGALQEVIGLDPSSLEGRLTLADLQSDRGDHKAALETLRAVPEEMREEPRLRRKLAWELYLTGDLDAALAAADALLGSPAAASPDADSVRLLKGLVLSAQGQNDESLVLLDKIRQADPENLPLALTVAHLLQRERRNAEAAAVLGKVVEDLARQKKTKEEREVRVELAQIWFEAEDWDRVIEAAAPLLAADDESVRMQGLLLQVDAQTQAKRYDEALALLDAKGGKSSLVESRRAEILVRAGRAEEGRKRLNDLAAGGETAAALAAAQSFQRLDLHPDSIPILERLVTAQPGSAVAHFLLGAAYERGKKRPEAVAELRRVLQIDPEFHAALNYLGYTLAESGEHLDEALSLVEKAVALEPDNGAYVDSLGWTYYQLGRHEQARGFLERAARLEPADATLQEHLGDVYVALGQNDRAREAYRRALELGDDNADQVRRKLDGLGGGAAPRP